MAIRGQGSRAAGFAETVAATAPGPCDGVRSPVTALDTCGGWQTTDPTWHPGGQGLTPSADGTMIHYHLRQ